MSKDKLSKISRLLFVFALLLFLFSSIYSWHTVSYSSTMSSVDYLEGFTPIAYSGTFIYKNSTSPVSYSFFLPFPIDKSMYNNSFLPGSAIGARTECMSGVWYIYLAIFLLLLAYGIILSFIRSKIIHFALTIMIAFLLIASLIVFFLFYPQALNYDIHRIFPDAGNIDLNGEYVTNDTLVISSLGMGFIFAVVSMVLFLLSGILSYISVPSEVEKVEKKHKVPPSRTSRNIEKKSLQPPKPKVEKKEIIEKKEEKKVEDVRKTEEKKERKERPKEEVKGKRVKVQCPNCGNYFEVEIIELPMTIQCPHCGAKGEIG